MRVAVLVVCVGLSALCSSCVSQNKARSDFNPPFIPESTALHKGEWCDLDFVTTENLRGGGFLVPSSAAGLTLRCALKTGVFYRDSIDREIVIDRAGIVRFDDARTAIQADPQLRDLFVDGKDCRGAFVTESTDPWRQGVGFSGKGAEIVKFGPQDEDGASGFFIVSRNDPSPLSLNAYLHNAIYFRDWEEATAILDTVRGEIVLGFYAPASTTTDLPLVEFTEDEVPKVLLDKVRTRMGLLP